MYIKSEAILSLERSSGIWITSNISSHLSRFEYDVCIMPLYFSPLDLSITTWNFFVDRTSFYPLKELVLFQKKIKYNCL